MELLTQEEKINSLAMMFVEKEHNVDMLQYAWKDDPTADNRFYYLAAQKKLCEEMSDVCHIMNVKFTNLVDKVIDNCSEIYN